MLAFHDFPAEHWKHLRTTNPIESTFATVRHRTIRTKDCRSEQDRARHAVQTRRGHAEPFGKLGTGVVSTAKTTCRKSSPT
ncbi:MAG: hypothetical protein DLM68_01450 [Hyphomicrobiales bacterium]|nr:MAG: hypothetical protein DLM68_01450 [Hyphomicrobiales bacterium]